MKLFPVLTIALACLAISSVAPLSQADVRLDRELSKSSPGFKAAFASVIEQASKATVQISCDAKPVVLGTVVASDGYILTKASELKLGSKFSVKRKDQSELDAKLIGIVPDSDLAMLKIDVSNLSAIEWLDAAALAKVEVGDFVAASGLSSQPLGVGIVSVHRRRIPAAAGVLGVSLAEIEEKGGAGVKVVQVLPSSGAENAGVKVDDIITAVNAKRVRSRVELIETIRSLKPGDSAKLSVTREDKALELTATLGANFTGVSPHLDAETFLAGPVSVRASAFPAVIQHDTILRPTECGGPLVNLSGKAIGINIARAGRTESYALPVDVILPLIKDLKAGKYKPTATAAAATTKPAAPAASAPRK